MRKKFILASCALLALTTFGGFLSSCGNNTTKQTSEDKTIVLTALSNSLNVGGSVTITAKINGKNIAEVLTWKSSNEAVAIVTETGKVTALTVGETTITAEAEGYVTGSIQISVVSTTMDVTLSVTPKFEEGSKFTSIPTGYGLYLGCALFGTSDVWGAKILTYNTEDKAYEITLNDLEIDSLFSYNIYLGTASNNWTYVNKESKDNAARTFSVSNEKEAIDATFYVESKTAAQVTLIVTTEFSDKTTLGDTVYVWVWDEMSNSTHKMSKNEELTSSYSFTNVPIGSLKISLTLGTSSAASWSVKKENIYLTIAEDTTEVLYTVTFAHQ